MVEALAKNEAADWKAIVMLYHVTQVATEGSAQQQEVVGNLHKLASELNEVNTSLSGEAKLEG